ncbi:MAG TPA: ABC transporter permease [Bryobacteraceae bacterium]|nr:ABC transporter permease [Bryobacteraceae bacterium]
MSLITRIRNLFKGDRLNRDLDEELNAHVEEAISNGDDPATARAALGNALQHREASRDIRTLAWAESLRADAVFAARQIAKSPVTSAAAVLSLGLAVGASISAFRLIDALLLRPLPILSAERLHIAGVLIPGRDGQVTFGDGMQYPLFRELREAARGEAELLAISFAERVDVNWSGSTEIEKARRQYVSGSMFTTFGLQPAIGRVLTERDDRTPGAHPYAVLSHDYWTRRFGQDRNIPGRTFRAGNQVFEVIGSCAIHRNRARRVRRYLRPRGHAPLGRPHRCSLASSHAAPASRRGAEVR